ncbi:phage tail protein [Paenibacillus guangzhouensis]|uniref:phage tail protein n=1 Tax=Paenibacillus guangzhouensis TaxID=1473112 RepID=UPI00187BB6ED|nr:hypothetical protein [Paenibacillus guangzhouensis]
MCGSNGEKKSCSKCNKASSDGSANISLKHALFQVQMVQRQVDLLKKSMRNMQMNIQVKTNVVRKQMLDMKAQIEGTAKFNIELVAEPKIKLDWKDMLMKAGIFIATLVALKIAIKKLGGSAEFKIKYSIEKMKPKRTKATLMNPPPVGPKYPSGDEGGLPPRRNRSGGKRGGKGGKGGGLLGGLGGLLGGLGKGLGGLGKMLNPFKLIGKIVPMFRLLGPVISKLSPLVAKLGDAFLKGMGKSSGIIKKVSTLIGSFQSVLINLVTMAGQRFAQFIAWLQPALPTIVGFITGVVQKAVQFFAPLLPPIMQVFQTVFGWIVENMPVFQAAIGSVFSALGPIIQTVVNVFQMLWGIWMEAWPTIQSILESVWAVVQPIFDVFITIIQILMNVIQAVWDALKPVLEMIWEALKPIIDGIGSMISAFGDGLDWVLDKVFGGGGGSGQDSAVGGASDPAKKHAAGLLTVPRDNYPALLHRNEAVLTAREANQYRNGGAGRGITINLNNPVAREEADFKKWAVILRTELESAGLNMA